MQTLSKTLDIHTSPHITSGMGVNVIMRNVVWALLPVSVFAVYCFGFSVLLLLTVSVISCVLTEHLMCYLTGSESTINDWSAVITGLLFGLTLPPGLPLWMAAVGGFLAIGLGKYLFGGLGYNAFNPALVGRATLQAAFPVAMTSWSPAFAVDRFEGISASTLALPFMQPTWDTVTSATPLGAMKFDKVSTASYELLMGFTSGSTGETSTVIILLGGIYLAYRKMLNWRIPVTILVTVFLLSGVLNLANPDLYPAPVFMLLSGGLMLGAVFMATDMVASPLTTKGVIVYGVLIGVLVVVIRIWGGLPEGVMYAILFANAVSPHIDNLIQPKVYGKI